ncbi:hypothetical protein [Noviherbaspirillum saxi]|uniref:hypothetical protein n=1 Tax=Noviherbaspirillum saxi TaxID=2320863 RepID=UPI0011C4795D|nr:hypothetical protein [Noviherbaspirillum saxi]
MRHMRGLSRMLCPHRFEKTQCSTKFLRKKDAPLGDGQKLLLLFAIFSQAALMMKMTELSSR